MKFIFVNVFIRKKINFITALDFFIFSYVLDVLVRIYSVGTEYGSIIRAVVYCAVDLSDGAEKKRKEF